MLLNKHLTDGRGRTYCATQCAAVRMWTSVMSAPPQNCLLPLRMAAMKGNWWFLAPHPFTM